MRHDLVDQQYPLEPDPAFRRRAAWLLQELESLPKGATVLDIGCGQGFYLPLYARLGLSASGVEPDPVPRAQAQKTALTLGFAVIGAPAERLPFADATPVVQLSLPVVQVRHLDPGETVGYGCTWVAKRPTTAVTLLAVYADGPPRSLANRAQLWAGNRACPLIGRVSMDLITVDVTDLPEIPDSLELLGPAQGIDSLAEFAGTISYELLATLGQRYDRQYQEHSA